MQLEFTKMHGLGNDFTVFDAPLASEGLDAHVAPFDVADAAAVRAGVAAVAGALGPVGILVNNAAVNKRGPLDGYSTDDWRALMAANLDGPFHVTQAVLPAMKARRAGKIVNICSLASDLGRPNIDPYAVSKGGLKQLTRALAVELAPHGIQVNGIAPGFFDTPMNAPLVADAELSAWVSRRTPAGRWGRPDEIAGPAVFLASKAVANSAFYPTRTPVRHSLMVKTKNSPNRSISLWINRRVLS